MRHLRTQCDLRPPHKGVSLSRYSQPAYSAARIHQSLRQRSTNAARQTWAADDRRVCDWTLEVYYTHARTYARTHTLSHTHTRTHARTHTHTHTRTYTHTLSHTHTHARTHRHMRTHTHTHAHTHRHTHSHARTHHTHTHTHTYTHSHTHTLSLSLSHTHTLSLTYTHTHTHTHTLSLSHIHTHTLTHTHTHTVTNSVMTWLTAAVWWFQVQFWSTNTMNPRLISCYFIYLLICIYFKLFYCCLKKSLLANLLFILFL